LHRLRVTQAELDYVGSITIDGLLVERAGLFEGEVVHVNNLANGYPWETYIIKAPHGSGVVCLNGPPAHHFKPGDLVVIWGTEDISMAKARDHKPRVVFVSQDEERQKFNIFDRLDPGTFRDKDF
jgi:aspartate 1-decarboxylase